MTATLNPTETVVTIELPDGVITAASEEEALAKYKRRVRAEALKAQVQNDWCDTGTNERLERLGLRRKGDGVTVKVRLVAERIGYMMFDAGTPEEVDELIGDGENPETLELATVAIGRGWKSLIVERAPERKAGVYKVGDPDDTSAAMRIGNVPYQAICEAYSSGRGYCTRPAGHVQAGDVQHAVGNGSFIIAVWDEPRVRTAAEGAVIGEPFEDYVRSGGRCRDRGTPASNPDQYTCTRRRGHDGDHVSCTSDSVVVGIWPNRMATPPAA